MLRRTFLQVGLTAAPMIHAQSARWGSFLNNHSDEIGTAPDPATLTIAEAAQLIRLKKLSPVELTKACLIAIGKINSALNAFITVTADSALAQARVAEGETHKGHWRGALHGIPVALKDNIDTAGVRTTAASALFKDRVPVQDAEAVRRLKNAGAILLGKTNLHEFAFGGTSAVSYFGPVHNPWALDRVPGGSSGGSAAATAMGLCLGALGTDTAGSLRIPASFCGVVGFKPTYGRVSMRGVIPASWSLDHLGPLSRTVRDSALIFAAIGGYDEMDPSTVPVPLGHLMPFGDTKNVRVGILRTPFFADVDPEIQAALEAAIRVLRTITASARDLELTPPVPGLMDVWTKVRGVEAYAYHSKWITTTPDLYETATRQRILEGSNTTATAYVLARNEMEILRRTVKKLFAGVDILITPTMPHKPVTILEGANPMAVSIRNTAPFNVLGLPSISLPCGFSKSGVPIGLQIIGAPFSDALVLNVAHNYEQATAWHSKHPHQPAG